MKLLVDIDVPELAPAIEFYTRALGLTHSRTLDDGTAELTGASAAGAKQETGHIDWRSSRCMSFSDPFGHGFRLIQFGPGGSYTD